MNTPGDYGGFASSAEFYAHQQELADARDRAALQKSLETPADRLRARAATLVKSLRRHGDPALIQEVETALTIARRQLTAPR